MPQNHKRAIEQFFGSNAISKSGVKLLDKSNALALIGECRIAKIQLLGIDRFYILTDGRFQPSLEHSIENLRGTLHLILDDVQRRFNPFSPPDFIF